MSYQKSRNKYGARKSEYAGRIYDSAAEATYAATLELMKQSGEISSYVPQYKIPLDVNDVHVCNYYIDFLVERPNGRVEAHEVKGYATPTWRVKWKLAQALYPDYTFVLIT